MADLERPKGQRRRRAGWRWGIIGVLLVAVVCLLYYRATVVELNQTLIQPRAVGPAQLRPLPYPFRAAVGLTLAPGPGLDLQSYLGILEKLNNGSQDREPGLEAGGSFFFYPPSEDWLAYFNPPGANGNDIRQSLDALIRAGIVDVLDSYGQDQRFKREMAQQALAALAEQGLTLQTWADRFKSPDNISLGGGRGGHPNRMAYHLDLTIKAGFKFFWLGRSTPLLGQEAPIDWGTFFSLYRRDDPLASLITITGVFARHFGSVLTGSSKDVLTTNRLLAKVKFKDGSSGFEYVRYKPPGQDQSLAASLPSQNLEQLVLLGARIMVGVVLERGPSGELLSPEDSRALDNLTLMGRQGLILVTTATRLLNATLVTRNLRWRAEDKDGETKVLIVSLDDPLTGPRKPTLTELAGLTFYVPNSARARLFLDGQELPVHRNLIDFTGRESISLPWPWIEFSGLDKRQTLTFSPG